MIYLGMLVAGIVTGYLILEKKRLAEGALFLACTAAAFPSIPEGIRKKYGMTHRQLQVMTGLLFLGLLIFLGNFNRLYVNETIQAKDSKTLSQVRILHAREGNDYNSYEVEAVLASGKRRILLKDYSEKRKLFLPGTLVKAAGDLRIPDEAGNPRCFDYRLYLKTKGIVYTLNAKSLRETGKSEHVMDAFHRKLQNLKGKFLEEFQGSEESKEFLKGILFGDKSGIDEETYQEFAENGTAHILAVSGLHVGFLIALLTALARNRKYWKVTVAISALLFLYGELTEWNPSTLRAAIIAVLSMCGMYLRKPFDLTTGTAAAAMIVLLFRPYQLFHTGFLMSYLAIAGMAFLTKPLSHFLGQRMAPAVALQCMMVPFQIHSFNRFNPLSMVINLPVIFLASVAVPFGMILFLLNLVIPIGGIPAQSLEILTSLIIRLNRILYMKGNCSSLQESGSSGGLICFYLILMFVNSELFQVLVIRREWTDVSRILGGFVLPALLLVAGLRNPLAGDGVIFLDVGQGDGIHLQTEGKNLLVDGGGNSQYEVGKKVLQPYFLKNGVTKIDGALCTHLHMDHFKGVQELAERFPVQRFYVPSVYRGLSETPSQARFLKGGDVLKVSDEMSIKVLWPIEDSGGTSDGTESEKDSADENRLNGVYRIDYRGTRILVTGDLLEEGEEDMLQYYRGTEELRCDVLKVAHHGSHSSSSDAFLNAVQPSVAVIQVGARNLYGHPHKETLEKLKKRGIPVYRNDRDGAIGLRVRNRRIRIDRMKE